MSHLKDRESGGQTGQGRLREGTGMGKARQEGWNHSTDGEGGLETGKNMRDRQLTDREQQEMMYVKCMWSERERVSE